MSWAGIIAAIDADLTTAGATLDPAIVTIRRGEPDAVNMPIIGYWYVGDRESLTGGNTFVKTNIEEGVLVRIYRPGSVRATSLDDSLEVWVRSAVRACKAALWGDTHLGGDSIGLDITDTVAAWEAIGNVLCRLATLD